MTGCRVLIGPHRRQELQHGAVVGAEHEAAQQRARHHRRARAEAEQLPGPAGAQPGQLCADSVDSVDMDIV